MSFRQNQPRWIYWLPLLGAGLIVIGLLIGISLQTAQQPSLAVNEVSEISGNAHGIGTVEEILRYIEAKYVDDLDRDQLVDGVINNLLGELDPHSSYISADQIKKHRSQLEGSVVGIGVDVLMIRDSVTVVSTLPGSPANVSGLLPYDRIIRIGDSTVSGRNLSTAGLDAWLMSMESGPVNIEVFRPGIGMLAPVSLIREKIIVPSVDEGQLIEGNIAYIKIRQFGVNTYQEFMVQLEKLSLAGARHLILDLRGNSGGYLDEAVSLLSQIFPDEGKLLVYTEGAHNPRKEYKSSGRIFFPVDQVSVLIDRGSASASEIVAGAIQDWDRGTIVGQRSFGKGLVQELYTLQDGGALHITVSRYFTPSGRSIQRDYEEIGLYRKNALDSADNQKIVEFVTSGGRKVYGGGGIAPDVPVENPLSRATPQIAEAISSIESFAFKALERENDGISTEELLPELRTVLASSGLELSDADWMYYRKAFAEELEIGLSAKREGKSAGARLRIMKDPFVAEAIKAVKSEAPLAKSL